MPQEFEYFPLYVHRLLSSKDVRRMDATAFGGFMLLLIESFISNPQGYLSDDQEELRFLARMSVEEWAKYSEKLTSKFRKRKGDLIYNPTMIEVIANLKAIKAHRVNSGRAGAKKRWGQVDEPLQSDSDAIADPLPTYSNKTKRNRTEENRKKEKEREEKGKGRAEERFSFDRVDLEADHD